MANKYDDDYTRVYWENLPSHNTPINQQNLNKMDAQIKTLTTRVSDMSAYIPNVMYVDELPEQGVEGLLYVTALIEHGFTLDGELPNHFKSQSALDSWVNDGHFAFMLHIHTADPNYDDTYVIISDITVDTIESTSGFYEVNTIYDDIGDIDYSSSYYQYNPSDKKWYQHAYYGISVGDKLIAYNEASATNTKIGNMWYATDGEFDTDGDTYQLGIENIVGDLSIGEHISTHAPITYYTSASNTYEIYQAKPIRVLDPRNVYMWNDDTHSFFGFQKEFEAGQNITFTQQGTKIIISATGGGSGVEDTVVTFTYNKTDGTVTCDTLWQDIINKYNAKTLKVQIREIQRNSAITRTVNLTQFKYGGGTTNDMYFEYLEGNILTTYIVVKNPNPNLEEYTITTINKDISGGGGSSDVITPLYVRNGGSYSCNMSYAEVKALYESSDPSVIMPQFIDNYGNHSRCCEVYIENDNIYLNFDMGRVSNVSGSEYSISHYVLIHGQYSVGLSRYYNNWFQPELSAGDGISIVNNTISVNYPNGDTIEY